MVCFVEYKKTFNKVHRLDESDMLILAGLFNPIFHTDTFLLKNLLI